MKFLEISRNPTSLWDKRKLCLSADWKSFEYYYAYLKCVSLAFVNNSFVGHEAPPAMSEKEKVSNTYICTYVCKGRGARLNNKTDRAQWGPCAILQLLISDRIKGHAHKLWICTWNKWERVCVCMCSFDCIFIDKLWRAAAKRLQGKYTAIKWGCLKCAA